MLNKRYFPKTIDEQQNLSVGRDVRNARMRERLRRILEDPGVGDRVKAMVVRKFFFGIR